MFGIMIIAEKDAVTLVIVRDVAIGKTRLLSLLLLAAVIMFITIVTVVLAAGANGIMNIMIRNVLCSP